MAGEADEPAGFLMARVVEGCLHIDQVSVDPGSARRGLLEHAASQAAADGIPALTLTTFASVPWNAPYYARCGFRVLDGAGLTPGLRAIRHHEAGLLGPVAAGVHAPRRMTPPDLARADLNALDDHADEIATALRCTPGELRL